MTVATNGLVFLLLAEPAYAHSPVEGLGDFFNGVLHPVLVPAHLISLMALGLFLGQQPTGSITRTLPTFMISIAVALLLAGQEWLITTVNWVLACSVLPAILAVLAYRSPNWLTLPVTAVVAITIGGDSRPEYLSGENALAAMLGTGIGASLALIYVTALTEHLQHQHWQRILVRVIASWTVASALLVISLSLLPVKTSIN